MRKTPSSGGPPFQRMRSATPCRCRAEAQRATLRLGPKSGSGPYLGVSPHAPFDHNPRHLGSEGERAAEEKRRRRRTRDTTSLSALRAVEILRRRSSDKDAANVSKLRADAQLVRESELYACALRGDEAPTSQIVEAARAQL